MVKLANARKHTGMTQGQMLGLATIAGALVSFVSLPFIVQIYGFQEFGKYSSLFYFVSLVGPLSAFRMEWLLPAMTPGSCQFGVAQHVCVRVAFLIAALSGVFVWCCFFAESPAVLTSLLLCIVVVQQVALSQIIHALAIANHSLYAIAACRFLMPVGTAVVQLTVYEVAEGMYGLFVGWGAGLVLSNGIALVLLKKHVPLQEIHVGFTGTLVEARGLFARSKVSVLVNAMTLSVMPLQMEMITSMFGDAASGKFAAVWRFLVVPGQLVGGVVGQILWADVALAVRKGNPLFVKSYHKSILLVAGLVGFGMAFLMILFIWLDLAYMSERSTLR